MVMLKNINKSLFSFIASVLIATSFSQAHNAHPEGFAELVEPLLPAVVNVFVTHKPKASSKITPFPEGSPFNEFQQFFEKFMHPMQELEDEDAPGKKLVPLGSGFIIDKSGYIVTNYHVIAEAAGTVAIKLVDGTEFKAKVIGHDRKTDLALLKVENKKPLPYVEFGDSEKSRVGDWVITIGNPFGIGTTVTTGIVSANGRDIASEGIVDNFIQTDASINRGNSGGPMFNMSGKVIGVNTAILSTMSGGSIGIGFATPSSLAKDIINQLKESGKVRRGKLGIRMQAITQDIAESMSLMNTDGVLVVEVVEDSAAAAAGIKVGDVIVSFNHEKIKTLKELARIIGGAPIGQKMPFTLIRKGKKMNLHASLTEDNDPIDENLPFDSDKKFSENQYAEFNPQEILGGQFATLTSEVRNRFKIHSSTEGIVILNIKRNSVWHKRGLKPGDVISTANQNILTSVEQFIKIIKSSRFSRNTSVLLLVLRREHQFFTTIPLGSK
jgi:serine protease Do